MFCFVFRYCHQSRVSDSFIRLCLSRCQLRSLDNTYVYTMVVLDIDGLPVVFPYQFPYPEQLSYMKHLKRALDSGGHAVLEMPSGTGKTQTLLSLITAYLTNRISDKSRRKFVYCTRTVEEMYKVLDEMKILTAARSAELSTPNELLTAGLASRRHLCIHPVVSKMEASSIDNGCRSLTSSWVRESVQQGTADANTYCDYLETYDREGAEAILRPGVYSLNDLRAYGLRRNWCPYFLARQLVSVANIVVYSYHYLLDPKVAGIVSTGLPPESIIVFGMYMFRSFRLVLERLNSPRIYLTPDHTNFGFR